MNLYKQKMNLIDNSKILVKIIFNFELYAIGNKVKHSRLRAFHEITEHARYKERQNCDRFSGQNEMDV